MRSRVVNVAEVTANAPSNYFSKQVAALCGLLAACDGLDNQALAFTAPVIAQEWNLRMHGFVPVFTIGLVGMMVGSLIGGWVGDRWGRKRAILIAGLCFSAGALLTPWCTNLLGFMAVRLIGGFGIGGLPAAIAALIAESVPERNRATLTLLALVGIPIGGFVGGFGASWVIPMLGWRWVFYFAGAFSLMAVLLGKTCLPESAHFMVLRRRNPSSLASILNRIEPGGGYSIRDEFTLPTVAHSNGSYKQLFQGELARMTTLFWITECIQLMIFYVLVNWTPTLFHESGYSIETAALGAAVLNIGAITATVALGPICRRFGEHRVIASTFVLASVGLLTMVIGNGDQSAIMVGVFFAGAGCIGGQAAVVALIANSYPVHVRSLGVGWALTVGRIGSIVSPSLVGLPLSLGWSTRQILMLPILPSLLGALCIALCVSADEGKRRYAQHG